MQLHEYLSTGPSTLNLVMLRTSVTAKGAFIAAAFDMINVCVTIAFSYDVLAHQSSSLAVPFVSFFILALIMNAAIGIGLIRHNKAPNFAAWLEPSPVEITLTLIACMPNTMNLAIMW